MYCTFSCLQCGPDQSEEPVAQEPYQTVLDEQVQTLRAKVALSGIALEL